MEKKQNVPALRFQGFSGEWKRKTLGDFGNVAMNRRIFKEQTSETGEIPFYKIGTFGKEPDAYISRQLFEEYKAKYPYPDVGDILLSAAGSIGKTVEYTGKDEYFQDSNIVWLKHDERLDNPFLKYFYSKVKWGTLEGGTVKRLYNKILLETEIVLPEIIEQKKIGKFFASYDRMIAHQEGKIRKLQQFRQAMLTKLFPREGAAEPELRFRGFSGKWKCCRFGDIADIRRGLTYSPSSLRKSGIRVLRASNIQDDTFYIREDDVFVEPDAVNIPMVKNGDILIAAAGGSTRLVGKHAVIYGIEENSVAHGGFMLLASSDYPEFTNALMGANWYRHFVQQFIAGGNGAIGNLNKSDLEEQIVFVPDVAEMEQIGNFFKELDTYISLQQKKLERMQRLKAALLEKLFV